MKEVHQAFFSNSSTSLSYMKKKIIRKNNFDVDENNHQENCSLLNAYFSSL